MNIAIVDDESVIVEGLTNLLTSGGNERWNILSASTDPEQLLDACDWDNIDLLLADINMPGMSGFEMIGTLRERGFDTQVIIISGYAEFEYARQALRNKAVDFIIKPVSGKKLLEAVSKAEEIIIQQKKQKSSRWYIQKNLTRLRQNFFEEYLFETRKIEGPERERMVTFLGLENMHYILFEFLSGADGETIIQKISGMRRRLQCDIFQYSLGEGLCAILIPCNAETNTSPEDILEYLDLKEIIWNDSVIADSLENLPELHTVLINRLIRDRNARGFQNILTSAAGTDDSMEVQHYYSLPVQKAVRFIHGNYGIPLSLTILSEEVNVHPTYLSNLFKKQTGLSLIDYINHYRITVSKEILKDPLSKIYWVSEKVGFQNQRYFSQVFKKITGMTPVQYRSSCYFNTGKKPAS